MVVPFPQFDRRNCKLHCSNVHLFVEPCTWCFLHESRRNPYAVKPILEEGHMTMLDDPSSPDDTHHGNHQANNRAASPCPIAYPAKTLILVTR